jgi:hypothetical protein
MLVASVKWNLGMRPFAQVMASFAKNHGIIDQKCCRFGSDLRQIWFALYLQSNTSFCLKTVDSSPFSMVNQPNKPKKVFQSSSCAPPFTVPPFKNCVFQHAHSWFPYSSSSVSINQHLSTYSYSLQYCFKSFIVIFALFCWFYNLIHSWWFSVMSVFYCYFNFLMIL